MDMELAELEAPQPPRRQEGQRTHQFPVAPTHELPPPPTYPQPTHHPSTTTLRHLPSHQTIRSESSESTIRPPRHQVHPQASASTLRPPVPSALKPVSRSEDPLRRSATSNQQGRLLPRPSATSLRALVKKKSAQTVKHAPAMPSPAPAPAEGDNAITAPAKPAQLRRWSECLDVLSDAGTADEDPDAINPAPLPPVGAGIGGVHAGGQSQRGRASEPQPQQQHQQGHKKKVIVTSPSGTRMDPETFLAREDRPMTIRERTRMIRLETERQAREWERGEEERRREVLRRMEERERRKRRGCGIGGCVVM